MSTGPIEAVYKEGNEHYNRSVLVKAYLSKESTTSYDQKVLFYYNYSGIDLKIGDNVRIVHNGNWNEPVIPQASAECIELIE